MIMQDELHDDYVHDRAEPAVSHVDYGSVLMDHGCYGEPCYVNMS